MGTWDGFDDDDSSGGDGWEHEPVDSVEAEIEQLCRLAMDRLDEGDETSAHELILDAIAVDDDHPFPSFVLALLHERRGDIPAARYLADQALKGASTNPDVIRLRAQLDLREQRLPEAEALLRYGVAHNPDDADLHEVLARVCLARGRHDDAAREASVALRLDPMSPGARAVRIAAFDDAGDPEAMLAVLRQTVQLHPDDPYPMVELAAAEAEHGNLDRARRLLARAQRLAPRDPRIVEVREMLDEGHAPLLLRPLPAVRSWLHEFPGGYVGFLGAFLVAALPLHALSAAYPSYGPPVAALLALWACVAAYAWVAPPLLAARLNRSAGHIAEKQLQSAPGEATDLERLADAVTLYAAGRAHRRALSLLIEAADREWRPAVRIELARSLRLLLTPSQRAARALTSMPGDVHLAVMLSALLILTAPFLATWVGGTSTIWLASSIIPAGLGFALALMAGRSRESLEDACATARAAADGTLTGLDMDDRGAIGLGG